MHIMPDFVCKKQSGETAKAAQKSDLKNKLLTFIRTFSGRDYVTADSLLKNIPPEVRLDPEYLEQYLCTPIGGVVCSTSVSCAPDGMCAVPI